jgi:hypothetical protein
MPGKNIGLRSEAPVDSALIGAFMDSLRDTISVTSVVVFGSRATGDNLEDSDYDILMLSPDFKHYDRVERIQLLLESWPGTVALEPVAMTPEEFGEAEGALVWDILEDGLVIREDGVFERKRLLFLDRIESGKLEKGDGFWSFS